MDPMPSEAVMALLDASTCLHSFGNVGCSTSGGVESSIREGV